MGVIPVPTEFGDDCLACWAAGLTPKYVKLFLSGISMGENWIPGMGLPPNGYHDLRQSAVVPCQWLNLNPGPPTILWRPHTLADNLSVPMPLASNAFVSRGYADCSSYYPNDKSTWENNTFYGGYAHITTPEILADIIESITPMIDPDPRMECFPMADKHIAIRYAGKRDATNIMFKIDTDP